MTHLMHSTKGWQSLVNIQSRNPNQIVSDPEPLRVYLLIYLTTGECKLKSLITPHSLYSPGLIEYNLLYHSSSPTAHSSVEYE